ncbi:MAG: transposase [Pirellulales bacterium]|nr:transposase [Pirellulales bacterium]
MQAKNILPPDGPPGPQGGRPRVPNRTVLAVIAQRNREHGSGLGKVRWVVERTIRWLKGMRRMRLRYDRLATMQLAWNALAASVMCFRLLE